MDILAKLREYNVNVDSWILGRKRDYYSAFTLAEETVKRVSDCNIEIFSKSSFRKSRATLLTVGLGTPNSSTTFV